MRLSHSLERLLRLQKVFLTLQVIRILLFISWLERFWELMRSRLQRKSRLEAMMSRTPRIPLIIVGGVQRDKSDREATKAGFFVMLELVTEDLESAGSRVWARRTRVDTTVRLGWLAAVLNLGQTSVPPCNLPEKGKRLLLTSGGGESADPAQRK